MRKSASEIINDLETRVANLEKEAIFGLFKPKTLKEQNEARLAGRTEKSAGRRYDDDEWVFFIHEGTGLEDDREGKRTAERLRNKFEDCIYDICEKYGLSICDEEGISHVAFKAYASLVGHGTGLWDLHHPDADMLEGIVETDPECGPLSQAIDNLPYDLGLA